MNNATILADNPYDAPPPFRVRWATPLAAASVFITTVVLMVVAFPPYNVSEMAYVFAAPAVLWAYRRPSFRVYAAVVLGAQVVAWTILLGWLHNVTWLGLLLLGPFIGVWVGSWFLAAWWLMPKLQGHGSFTRIVAILGLAGLWVVIEWTRTWLFSGFPWLSLAASQWQRASILQIAAFTGAGGISFVLMAMNLGFAAYAHRLIFEPLRGFNRRSQEFFASMFLLLVCMSIHLQETFNRHAYAVPLARVSFVQPYIPQSVKWDESQSPAVMDILEKGLVSAAARRPDLILWPEAVTPWAVKGDDTVREWTESLVRKAGAPLLMGSIAVERNPAGDEWRNGAFLVEPEAGLIDGYYTKRHLVPFGEFVPFRPILGWIGKFVPIGGDFVAGENPSPLIVATRNSAFVVGPLICYEDVFPSLARESVRAGADVLTVLTNNGWFGEGGAAHQHAAHSVLRAVETRRPVLRAGNGGWSGWIDEFGAVRAVLTKVTRPGTDGVGREVVSIKPADAVDGTIYFRGSASVDVTRDARWIGEESFYVKHGDWFVAVCLGLFAAGSASVSVKPRAPVEPEPEAEA
ncbi:apolipoprotein N-acyltransferase [Opitutaceae bacterium]